jgi:hypothetical protein
MHIYTLVKIAADDESDARNRVQDALEETIGEGMPFDYVSDCTVLTEESLPQYSSSSFEALEERYIAFNKSAEEKCKESIKTSVATIIYKVILPLSDAPLLVNETRKEVQEAAQEVLKSGVGKDIPNTLVELVDLISDATIRSCEGWSGDLSYALRSYDRLWESSQGTTLGEVAMSKNIHFIDNTKFEPLEEGQEIFYVITDRHS